MAILARDIMERDVRTVDPDMSLAALEDTLLQHRIGGAPVVEHGELIGIVSRSDIVRTLSLDRSLTGLVSDFYRQIVDFSGEPAANAWKRAQGVEEHLAKRQVRDAMTPELITVPPDATLAQVARLMVERHIHRLLVTTGKQLLGLISSTDLVQLIVDGRVREA
jgi:CBS domain-containing protein